MLEMGEALEYNEVKIMTSYDVYMVYTNMV